MPELIGKQSKKALLSLFIGLMFMVAGIYYAWNFTELVQHNSHIVYKLVLGVGTGVFFLMGLMSLRVAHIVYQRK